MVVLKVRADGALETESTLRMRPTGNGVLILHFYTLRTEMYGITAQSLTSMTAVLLPALPAGT